MRWKTTYEPNNEVGPPELTRLPGLVATRLSGMIAGEKLTKSFQQFIKRGKPDR